MGLIQAGVTAFKKEDTPLESGRNLALHALTFDK